MLLSSTVKELKQHRAQIDKAIDALSALDNSPAPNGTNHNTHKTHTMSRAARKRLSEAMKARWASGKMKRR
jgi:hypothetical protein